MGEQLEAIGEQTLEQGRAIFVGCTRGREAVMSYGSLVAQSGSQTM